MNDLAALSEPVSRSTRGPFRFERDMFASVCDLLPQRIARVPDRWTHLREPAIGNVIPDLLFGEWGDELRPLRRNFTFVEAHILALLEQHDELTESEVCQMLHLSRPAATRAFKRIERSGLVIQTSSEKISLDAGVFTRGLVVTAIELKLSRWREALDQATSYLKFADRSYVVLDADRSTHDQEMIEAFRVSRVGLFMLGAGDITEVVAADEQPCISVQRVQAVQKLCISLTASGRLKSGI